MKTNYALILAATLSGVMVQTGVSQDPTPAPPAATPPPLMMESAPAVAPAPALPAAPALPPADAPKKKTVAPAKKAPAAAHKKVAAATEPEKPAAPLTPGTAVARQNNVNVRGQAAINSEVVARLKKGDKVQVLEEVTLKKPKVDEPAKWAKVALPANTVVWVHSTYIDPASKAVVPKKLNLRSGPGENYSVVGRVEKGTVVKEIETKGEWVKIEAPSSAYGFVAAHLLTSEPNAPALAANEPPKPPTIASVTPPAPVVAPVTPPTEMAVVTTPPPPVPATDPAPIAAPPVTTPAPAIPPLTTPPTEAPAAVPPVAAVTTPAPVPDEEEKEELIKRVISREGIVKRSVSIQAPSFFVLESLDTGKTVNYLFSTNMNLKDFRDQRIVVTGEEQLDERWPNTPVIYVDTLQPVKQ